MGGSYLHLQFNNWDTLSNSLTFSLIEQKKKTLRSCLRKTIVVFSLHCSGIVAFESNIDATRHQLLLVKLYLQFQSCCFLLASCSIAACNTFAAEFLRVSVKFVNFVTKFCSVLLVKCLHIAVFPLLFSAAGSIVAADHNLLCW